MPGAIPENAFLPYRTAAGIAGHKVCAMDKHALPVETRASGRVFGAVRVPRDIQFMAGFTIAAGDGAA